MSTNSIQYRENNLCALALNGDSRETSIPLLTAFTVYSVEVFSPLVMLLGTLICDGV